MLAPSTTLQCTKTLVSFWTMRVFFGYDNIHKCYKCLLPSTGCVYISRDVTFDENVFPFPQMRSRTSPKLSYDQLLLHPCFLLLLSRYTVWKMWVIILIMIMWLMSKLMSHLCSLLILYRSMKHRILHSPVRAHRGRLRYHPCRPLLLVAFTLMAKLLVLYRRQVLLLWNYLNNITCTHVGQIIYIHPRCVMMVRFCTTKMFVQWWWLNRQIMLRHSRIVIGKWLWIKSIIL